MGGKVREKMGKEEGEGRGAPILSHHRMKYLQITSDKPETIKYKVFPVY